ncbi:MAG TPA: hypothetical protein IGS53_06540 [Leptolyngbyaceae cyanobacterium M33_DOE_097]|uniref:Uncharacterized protein n=1 Tax=Oscillatoriales cyanobacterium SpSt-418 TaxID=2282169 RepID=A0A7C3PI50_9CYAN|nr:hypothetical protein [Leptolyngbyaceae cyanobacterium M33_DOE_097]
MSDLTNSSALFVQLQQRYPGAGLITELVQVHQEQFIVRALVQLAGAPFVSGMAAAKTIEQAEDAARQRVIQLLGITTGSELASVKPSLQSHLLTSPLDNGGLFSMPTPPPVSEPDEPAHAAAIPPLPTATFAPLSTPAIADLAPPPEEISPIPPEIKPFEPAPKETPARKKSTRATKPAPEPEPEPDFPPDFPPEELEDHTPVDLSELIVMTDIEMQRVGWKRKTGQEHLLDTYGVKTRAELNEDQLLEFLHFLRALPSQYDTM